MKLKLDWSDYENAGLGDAYADIPKDGGDYGKAVAVCINSMTCLRPIDKGVMCPSFRIHGDSEFSPGGRSRLLKKQLNGEITPEEQNTLDQVMEACVACKGCKRECEANLDMARIRTEYLAQRFKAGSVPLRAKLFASLADRLDQHPRLSRWGVNLANRMPIVRAKLGLAANRRLPVPQVGEVYTTHSTSAEGGEVILWIDSYSHYFAPDAVRATISLLEHGGYRLHLLQHVGDGGRSAYSQGLVDTAQTQAQRMLEQLKQLPAEVPIIGIDPSALLMLRDEWGSLSLGSDAADLGNRALLLSEFLARELMASHLALQFKSAKHLPPVLVHGHCHEKSVGAMKSMRKLLKRIPDLDFRFIEASCCGGAGSFAYESEHVDEARQMAELALVPAIKAEPDAIVVANGFSCQQQIRSFGERPVLHLAELLLSLVDSRPS